ncbi:hypothetical protein, partial [Mesorhizobium sp. WSM4989]|uniref:hypothetical protein n=1 Tax=Mesorhizobium sp. WSM4989 TaxID=3038541 RepID=UPI002416749E
ISARAEAVRELRNQESILKNLSEVSLLRSILAFERGDRELASQSAIAAMVFSPRRADGVVPRLNTIGEKLANRIWSK